MPVAVVLLQSRNPPFFSGQNFTKSGALSSLPCFVYCTLVMAQLGMSKCSMKCSVHLTTLDRTLQSFGFFPISRFGEMFGTFDRGLISRRKVDPTYIIQCQVIFQVLGPLSGKRWQHHSHSYHFCT